MPTSDAFFAATEIVSNLARLHDNLRKNVQVIQAAYRAGTLTIPVEQALQDLGQAFQQRLDMNDALLAKFPGPLTLTPEDIAAVQADLKTTIDTLVVATAKDAPAVDAVVAEVLATVTEGKQQLGKEPDVIPPGVAGVQP